MALAVLLPGPPAGRGIRLGGVPRPAGNPRVAAGLGVVALLVTGCFTAYAYVRPVLEEVSGAGPSAIGTLFLVIGPVLAGTVCLVSLIGGSVRTAAPEAREGASALFVGVFNAPIALGAFTGGLIADGLGAGALALTVPGRP
ncbi:hypothetical protein [Streptomyces sp. NPDC088757]|uniref:hypothetical protein n=1 Tax=Streptomyces sp. NPDC088757 TaxID=3365889 RepID=UPI0038021C20